MTKADIAAGLARGLVLVQRAQTPLEQKKWIDELIAEGRASGFWEIHPEYKHRFVRRTGQGPKNKPSRQWLEEHPGEWLWEYPSSPLWFVPHLCNVGLYALWAGILLRKMARKRGKYPVPLTPEFLTDFAVNVAPGARQTKSFRNTVRSSFNGLMERLEKSTAQGYAENSLERAMNERPQSAVSFYCHPLDRLLARHGIAPMPKIEIAEISTPLSPEEAAIRKAIRDIIEGDE
jgi:hypothetical protein